MVSAGSGRLMVHIRPTEPGVLCGLCGIHPNESISLEHYREHVLPFKDECCSGLFARLCVKCVVVSSEQHQREVFGVSHGAVVDT